MKKTLFTLLAVALAIVACEPEQTPGGGNTPGGEETPATKGEFKITSEAAPVIGSGETSVKVEFTSTVAWTASLDVADDVAFLNLKSGTAEDTSVKVNVMSFSEVNTSRKITLTFKPEGLEAQSVVITQNGEFEPFFTLNEQHLYVGAAGGDTEFSFETNTEVEFEVDEEFDWFRFTLSDSEGGKTGKFAVDPTEDFGPRDGFVTISFPAILVPVLDDDGKATEETQPASVVIYITQEGKASLDWLVQLEESMVEGATNYSLAIYGDKYLVCNGIDVYEFDPLTGALGAKMDLGVKVKCITNDDVYNLLLLTGGAYTEGATVYALQTNGIGDPKTLIYWPNIYYGYGLDNMKAKGDVFSQAVVTMFNGGAPGYGGTNACLYWNISGGEAAWEKNPDETMVSKPTGNIVPAHFAGKDNWDSYRCAFNPVGARVSDGFVFNGYDGQYKFLFYNGTDWVDVLGTPYTWEKGVTSFTSNRWNGENYSVAINMSYFPVWAIGSDVCLMKGDGSTLEEVATLTYTGLTTDGLVAESNVFAYKPAATDVFAWTEGKSFAVYVVDGALKVMLKYTFSK